MTGDAVSSNDPTRPPLGEPAPGRAGRGGVPTAAALLLGVGIALVAAAGALAVSITAPAPVTVVELSIRYSHFSESTIRVPAGRPVTVVLRNDDPIDHEWIVGDAALHERHRTGTEPVHTSRPTEVSVPAGESRTTVVTFQSPGTLTFVCHLPGHEAYGMVGTVEVVQG